MAILDGKDKMATNFGNELVGLYYYILPETLVQANNGRDSKVFGYVPTIQSINYNPFIDEDDYNAIRVPLDSKHWGSPTSNTPNVYRLTSISNLRKTLGSYNLQAMWDSLPQDFETKMLSYPFRYYLLTDYMNPPLLIKPQLLNRVSGEIEVRVLIGLTQSSKYTLFVNDYKGDKLGNIEGIVNNNPLLYPVASSAYSTFLATSQSQYNTANSLSLMENDKSLQQGNRQIDLANTRNMVGGGIGIASSLANLFNGNIGGAVTGVMSGASNMYFDWKENEMKSQNLQENYNFRQYQIEMSQMAKKDDLLNTPRAIKSVGNDATYNKANARSRVDLLEYGLNPTYENRIKRFFHRYGYEMNEYLTPIIDSRKYFNFIKTANCQISSSKMSHDNIEEIKSIFNKGCTFWHIDNGAKIRDYVVNNEEVDS